jgi:hypothetical protein
LLQVDPSELAVGVRPFSDVDVSGEPIIGGDIYLYDTLPGGAGYAREVAANFEAAIEIAEELTGDCPANCDAACYRCLLDYGNQRHHGLMDRSLAGDVILYLRDATIPSLSSATEGALLDRLRGFAVEGVSLEVEETADLGAFGVVKLGDGRRAVIKPLHTLAVPSRASRVALASATTVAATVFASAIELQRQPFAVWKRASEIAR